MFGHVDLLQPKTKLFFFFGLVLAK